MADDPTDTELSLPTGASRCECWPTADADTEELHLDEAAVPATLRSVRTAVRAWSSRIGLDADTTEKVVLAVDEAVANVVDHAFRSCSGAGVDGGGGRPPTWSGRRMVLRAAGRPCSAGFAISVSDNGSWRPPPPDPGHRGRGVELIGCLAERSTITVTRSGTVTRMCWARL